MEKNLSVFLSAAQYQRVNKTSRENLTSASIYLLHHVPSSRDAVLEHIALSFEEAASTHILGSDVGPSSGLRGFNTDKTIQTMYKALQDCVKINSKTWAPIICKWAIRLLADIGTKFADKRGMPTQLLDVLHTWMSCRATNLLLELSHECMSVIPSDQSETCLDLILDCTIRRTPHFDWALSQFGCYFPALIIPRILSYASKEYRSQTDGGKQLQTSQTAEQLRFVSLIAVTNYLASHQQEHVNSALLAFFKDGLTEEGEQLFLIPFLLQVMSMSPRLLQVVAADVIDMLSPDVLNMFGKQVNHWKFPPGHSLSNVLSLVVHLITETSEGAMQLWQLLLQTTETQPLPKSDTQVDVVRVDDNVSRACVTVVENLLREVTRMSQHANKARINIPFIAALQQQPSVLCKQLLSSPKQIRWFCLLLPCVASYVHDKVCARHILAFLLQNATTSQQRSLFLELQCMFEASVGSVLPAAIAKTLDVSSDKEAISRLLHNCASILIWEQKAGKSRVRCKLEKALKECCLVRLTGMQWEHPHAIHTLKLLDVSKPMYERVRLQLISYTIVHFFRLFHSQDSSEKESLAQACIAFLVKLSRNVRGQMMVLHKVLDQLLTKVDGSCMGGRKALVSRKTSGDKMVYLLSEVHHLHQLQNMPFNRSVNTEKSPPLSKTQMSENSGLLVEVLLRCSQTISLTTLNTSATCPITPKAANFIANALVSYISPNVIYNQLAEWPDQEFAHVFTIERDVHIMRRFTEMPILWDILYMLSPLTSAIVQASVLLRALMSVLLHFWWNCHENKMAMEFVEPLRQSVMLLAILSRAKCLPRPLSHCHLLLPSISAYECSIVFSSIWLYLVENPPNVSSPTVDNIPCHIRYRCRIKQVLRGYMSTLGRRWYPMFSEGDVKTPEMLENTEHKNMAEVLMATAKTLSSKHTSDDSSQPAKKLKLNTAQIHVDEAGKL